MRRVRPRAGFTLVEVLAAGSLVAVILAIVAVILLSSVNIFARGARQDSARQLCLAVYDLYRSHMTSARDIAVDTGDGGKALSVQGGRVFYAPEGGQPEGLYPDAMYSGMSIRTVLSVRDGMATLRVEVLDEDGPVFYKESSFKLITLMRSGGEALLSPGAAQPLENPVIRLY